ncbi:MAG: type II toxin-antitoxin system HigB family toxin [Okeania sp. SIO3B3]|nr:type II toxin-antitoxin system HigB family toxin [Okeania sp. SIO3B3]
MHVISRKRLLTFAEKHPTARNSLDHWYRVMKQTNFDNFAMLRKTLPSADQVGNLTVFNIGGNKARLIAAMHYNRHRVYIRAVLTHSEYDKNQWRDA